MKRILLLVTISAFSIAIWISSCVHKPQIIITPANGNYPDSIASILITKCAGSGCHN